MKKLLLFIAVSAAVLPSFGQASKSVVFTDQKLTGRPELSNKPVVATKPKANISTNKGTATGGSSWFDYSGILATAATKGYYANVYPDSNISYTGSQGTSHVFIHSMGTSFDPTDSVYFAEQTSIGVVPNPDNRASIVVTNGNAYTVDSIAFPISYIRNTNNNDSMFIEIVRTTSTGGKGVYALQFTQPSPFFYTVTPDGKPRFGTAIFDMATSRLAPDDSFNPAKVVMGYEMNSAMWADTNANGFLNKFMKGVALPTPLAVAAGEIVVVSVSFKSGVNYPLNTPLTSANLLQMFTFDVAGAGGPPHQTVGSYQAGLLTNNDNKYGPYDSTAIRFDGHNLQVPSIIYLSDGWTDRFAFHVTCATCPVLKVDEVKNFITAQAYPNPATEEIHIPFVLKSNANVNVMLANTMGQVVATQNLGNKLSGEASFSTVNLSNGVYFYTVEANGERQTGRVVVSH